MSATEIMGFKKKSPRKRRKRKSIKKECETIEVPERTKKAFLAQPPRESIPLRASSPLREVWRVGTDIRFFGTTFSSHEEILRKANVIINKAALDGWPVNQLRGFECDFLLQLLYRFHGAYKAQMGRHHAAMVCVERESAIGDEENIENGKCQERGRRLCVLRDDGHWRVFDVNDCFEDYYAVARRHSTADECFVAAFEDAIEGQIEGFYRWGVVKGESRVVYCKKTGKALHLREECNVVYDEPFTFHKLLTDFLEEQEETTDSVDVRTIEGGIDKISEPALRWIIADPMLRRMWRNFHIVRAKFSIVDVHWNTPFALFSEDNTCYEYPSHIDVVVRDLPAFDVSDLFE